MPKDARSEPGSKGTGEYYRIVLTEEEFKTYRYHDVGDEGHLQRLAGQREDESWDTKAWLISKDDAHIEGEKLIPDTKDAKGLLEDLGKEIKHYEGDIFKTR